MMIFWVISTAMLLVALLFVLLPLRAGKLKKNTVQRDSANLEIFRDQIAEMDSELKNGLLSREMHEQGKQELQARLLDEVKKAPDISQEGAQYPFKMLAVVLLLLVVPLTAIGLYWKVGNRHALMQAERPAGTEIFGNSSGASLSDLEARVAKSPEDTNSLFMLANAYGDAGKFSEAAAVFGKLTQIIPDKAQLWADYADVLAMASGKTLLGRPTKLLDKALALDPDNFKALVLSGSAAMERGDYAATVRHWEKLLNMMPAEDENARMVESGIQHARALLAQKNGEKVVVKSQRATAGADSKKLQSGSETMAGTVLLSESLKSRADPNDTVFILVRAAQGSKMPLAIVRKQVRDLPYKFKLDDSTAMTPQMKISNFEQVVVLARVSKSGNAMPQKGDLQGMSATVKPGTTGLEISINQVLP
jgi:cytochrome c-type biogenesis protein CcmH